jgi:DNA-binding NtrC family response regulator
VQIIAATNRNLETEVAAGRFREDLFYRLNLVELKVPPLRERVEDIPEFIDFFSQLFAERYRQPVWKPSAEQLDAFCRYSWPGNIRQLSHVIEQSYVLHCTPDVPTSRIPARAISLPSFNLDELRAIAIRQALATTGGHKGKAARLLGVHANTLTRLLAQLGDEAAPST